MSFPFVPPAYEIRAASPLPRKLSSRTSLLFSTRGVPSAMPSLANPKVNREVMGTASMPSLLTMTNV